MKIFVTTISFNNNKATLECLESLEHVKKNGFKFSVIVIDNASLEKFKAEKSYKNFDLILLRSEENLGFSGGQNLGIKKALDDGADFIVVLNNDTIVDADFISQMVDSFSDSIGIVVPKIYFAKGFEFYKEKYSEMEKGRVIWYAGGIMDWQNIIGHHRGVDEVDNGQFDKAELTEVATGCCMMIKSEVFKNVGFLNDKYFLYYEDADFSMRAKKLGYKIFYEPKAVIWHKNAASAGGSGSLLQDYYISRNRMLFGFRYASFRTKFALIRESMSLLLDGRKWQKRGIGDFYIRNFGKGSFRKE